MTVTSGIAIRRTCPRDEIQRIVGDRKDSPAKPPIRILLMIGEGLRRVSVTPFEGTELRDVDVQAAIAGPIAEAHYGDIPEHLLARI